MISRLKSAPFSRIISPWSAHRNARPSQKGNSHGRSWAALRLVWRKKRNRSDRTIFNRHTREVVRIELKQFHRLASSTNQQVEIRQERATVPQQQPASNRFVHFKSMNVRVLCGNGNPIVPRTRDQLSSRSTFEPCRQSGSFQHRVIKLDFLTRIELNNFIQKQARDAANFSPARGRHQDRIFRSVAFLRRENAPATETHPKPYSQDFGDVLTRPAVRRFELPCRFSNRTSRPRLLMGNSSSRPISPVAVKNMPTEASGFKRMELTQPTEIVWRTEQRKNLTPQSQDGASHNSSTFDTQTVPAEPSSKTKTNTNSESTSLPNSRSTITKPVLDPAMVDRLTEDIIRRVERKMRIERERRGVGG